MDYYELMHKDMPVCVFAVSDETVESLSVNPELKEHLPLSVNNKKSLTKWLHSRSIPVTRQGLTCLGIAPFSFMLSNYGLSLSDCYWIKPVCSDEHWSDVNFYENEFTDTAILDKFDNLECSERNGFTPSASVGGDLQKKWIMHEGTQVLVKSNSGNTALQSVAEVLASMIYKKQGMSNCVEYDFFDVRLADGSSLGCCCKNFTTTELEFIPAIEILETAKKRQDQSYYQCFLDVCEQHDLNECKQFMSDMLSVDFILVNVDRHLNNFGILRNPDTLKWVKMAPVFDSGNAMFYNRSSNSILPCGAELLNTSINSFTSKMGTQTRLIHQTNVDTAKLLSSTEVYDVLQKDKSLSEYDREQRVQLLQNTKSLFEDFLNGKKIYGYEYQQTLKASRINGFD